MNHRAALLACLPLLFGSAVALVWLDAATVNADGKLALLPKDHVGPPMRRTQHPNPDQIEIGTRSPVKMPKADKGLFAPPFIKGVCVGLYGELPALSYADLFSEIHDLGATHVSLVVAWSQVNVRAVAIEPHTVQTVPDTEVRKIVRQARASGLEVLLFPIVHLDRKRSGEWRGKLTPVDPDLWWASYRRFIVHYARLAQDEEIAILSVGSELLDQEIEHQRWKNVIRAVREVYDGKLTYSANWDHFDHVTFWDQLDYAGMTGYFELSYDRKPTLEDMEETWTNAADVIATYRRRAGKPLLITEVGYPSQVGGAGHPWDYTKIRAYDGHTQMLAFAAMYRAWLQRDRAAKKAGEPLGLDGIFVWNYNGYGGEDDIGYTPRGKPATHVLRAWFGGPKPIRP